MKSFWKKNVHVKILFGCLTRKKVGVDKIKLKGRQL